MIIESELETSIYNLTIYPLLSTTPHTYISLKELTHWPFDCVFYGSLFWKATEHRFLAKTTFAIRE